MQKDIAALAAEEESAALRDTPGIFMRSAVGEPSGPRKYLRKVQTDIAALATEEEFAALRDIPGIFTRAAVNNSSIRVASCAGSRVKNPARLIPVASKGGSKDWRLVPS